MTARVPAVVVLMVAAAAALPGAQHFTSRALGVRVDVLVNDGPLPVTRLTAGSTITSGVGLPEVNSRK